MKQRTHLSLAPHTRRGLKVMAARFGVAPGDAVAALVCLGNSLPVKVLALAMAAADRAEGELVPADMSEAAYVEQVRALAAVPERDA